MLNKDSLDIHNPDNWGNVSITTLLNSEKYTVMTMKSFLGEQKTAYISDVQLVTLEHDNKKIKAVFKPLLDDDNDNLKYMHAEVAAFKFAAKTKLCFVPPTIIRKINIDDEEKEGSLQLYVKPLKDLWQDGEKYEEFLKRNISAEQIINYKIFCYMMRQSDVSCNNIILTQHNEENFLIGIDNANICDDQNAEFGESPFVRGPRIEPDPHNNSQESSFSFKNYQTIKDPNAVKVKEQFQERIHEGFYKRKFHKSYPDEMVFIEHDGHLWIQEPGDINVIKSTDEISKKTLNILEKIDMKFLKEVFGDNPKYFDLDDIIKRKNEVLENCKVVEPTVKPTFTGFVQQQNTQTIKTKTI